MQGSETKPVQTCPGGSVMRGRVEGTDGGGGGGGVAARAQSSAIADVNHWVSQAQVFAAWQSQPKGDCQLPL